MSVSEMWEIALIILGSIGSSGLIVLGLSSWLGKVWANRLMETERHNHEVVLADLRAKLEHNNQQSIAWLTSDLGIFKEKHLKGFNDKIHIYRLMIDMVAELLGDFDAFQETGKPFPIERFDLLNRTRIKIYGYIGMIAPQSVMDAQDNLIDYLLLVARGGHYEWGKVRELALALINEIRKDIGIDREPISYNGKL